LVAFINTAQTLSHTHTQTPITHINEYEQV